MTLIPIKEIVFEWDASDPTRFKAVFEDIISMSFDSGFARQLATALVTMADRVDARIDDAIDSLELQ